MTKDDVNKNFDSLTNKVEDLEEQNRQLKAEMQNVKRRGRRYKPFYEYRSPVTYMGLPLIHLSQGVNPETGKLSVSKGIFAIGEIAIGVFAIGGLSLGIFTIGGVSIGLVGALGGLSIAGCLAIGGTAIGGVAIGALALGYYAAGALAIGYYATGAQTYGQFMPFWDWIKELVQVKF